MDLKYFDFNIRCFSHLAFDYARTITKARIKQHKYLNEKIIAHKIRLVNHFCYFIFTFLQFFCGIFTIFILTSKLIKMYIFRLQKRLLTKSEGEFEGGFPKNCKSPFQKEFFIYCHSSRTSLFAFVICTLFYVTDTEKEPPKMPAGIPAFLMRSWSVLPFLL